MLHSGKNVWIGLTHGAQGSCSIEEEREDWMWVDGTQYDVNTHMWYDVEVHKEQPNEDALCGLLARNRCWDLPCPSITRYVCKTAAGECVLNAAIVNIHPSHVID